MYRFWAAIMIRALISPLIWESNVGGGRQNGLMTTVVDTLDSLVEEVRRHVSDIASSQAFHGATDDVLRAAVAAAGDALRAVEAIVIAGVAELSERSRTSDRAERLTTRSGCHDLNELVQRLTRAASSTATKWTKAAIAVEPQWDPLTGEERPARLPAVRGAFLDGFLGVDGVLAVAQPLLAMRDRALREHVLAADELIAEIARGRGPDAAPAASADQLRMHAQVWAALLDPDGAEPSDDERARRRSITIGRARNGLHPLRGDLLPETAAQLQRIFDADAGSVRFTRGEPHEEDESASAPVFDDRSPQQRRHDALANALAVAAGSRLLPTIGGAAPTLVVHVREADAVNGSGWAHAEGTDELLPLAVARQIACSGAIQRIVLARDGRITMMGTEERGFNRRQRRAIALRDGGCIIPGCGVPAGWCEIHHVVQHSRGGPTHVDNGVLLCWAHHRFIDSGVWQIRMSHGVPEVRAPRWLDRDRPWRQASTSPTRLLERVART